MDNAKVLESGQWLSESSLWARLGEFYKQKGEAAWVGKVPYQVTSNPKIAASYVDLILAFLEDWTEKNGQPEEPCVIVELGAGHGGFSHFMMMALEERAADFQRMGIAYRYLMTDLAPSNLAAWEVNPAIASWFLSGVAEAACYNCTSREPLFFAGRPIASNGPAIFIANYLFDSLPTEVFQLEGGEIRRAAVSWKEAGETEEVDPDLWSLELDFRPCLLDGFSTSVAGLLGEYQRMGLQGCLSLPVGALECIESLRDLTQDRFLIVCSDKGLTTPVSISHRSSLEIGDFASASMVVNLHAIMMYFLHEGGHAWMQSTQQDFLATAAWAMGCGGSNPMPRTTRVFRHHLDMASPGDLYSILMAVLGQRFQMRLGSLISILKLMEWDAAVFDSLYDAIYTRLPEATVPERADLMSGLSLVSDRRYCLTGASDTLFNVAHLLQTLQCWQSAIDIYEARITERGDSAAARYNLGLCKMALGQIDPARSEFEHAAALDPDFLPAQGFLYRLSQQEAADAT
jgi:tetratricopeptide (TPR) repeat protein